MNIRIFGFLQSRYYNASVGRFVNGDAPEFVYISSTDTGFCNAFTYCNNKLVNMIDRNGC